MFDKLLKKDKGKPAEAQEGAEGEQEKKPEGDAEKSSAPTSLGGVIVDLDRLKAQFDSFKEIRNAFTERFTRISEQIGELRSMMIERDRDLQKLEAKALRSIDLVEAVQPEKLMIELRKTDGKVEALRANLESNEAIMARISDELRDIRNRMDMYKGVEQVMKMNEEVKGELIDVKKVEATISGHADKVETMFMEMRKNFKELETFKDGLNEALLALKEHESDINALKIRTSDLVKREELDALFNKIAKSVEELKQRSGESPLSKDLEALKDMLKDLKV